MDGFDEVALMGEVEGQEKEAFGDDHNALKSWEVVGALSGVNYGACHHCHNFAHPSMEKRMIPHQKNPHNVDLYLLKGLEL